MAELLQLGTLKVKRVEVVRDSGPDRVILTLDGPTGFPALDKEEPGAHPPSLIAEVAKGHAEEWLRMAFGWEKGDPRYAMILGPHAA